MSSSPTAAPLEEDDVQQRLEAVQKAVRKATEEALIAANAEKPRQLESAGTDSTSELVKTENDDPNASFALGMTLFGQETTIVESEIRQKLTQVESQLKELVVQQHQPSEETQDTVYDAEALEAEAQELTRRIAFLRECSSARSYLDEATTEQDWIESASLLSKAQTALAAAEAMVQAEEEATTNTQTLLPAHRILESIRIPLRRKRVDLVSRGEAFVRSCVVLSSDSLKVRSPMQAYDVLEAMGIPPDTVRRLADDLYREIFQPLLESHRNGKAVGSAWIFREDTRNETSGRHAKGPINTLEWSSRSGGGQPSNTECVEDANIAAWGATLNFIQKIMVFVQERVLLQRLPLCETVGSRLFGKRSAENSLDLEAFGLESNLIGDDNGLVMKPIIRLMWDTCIPSDRWSPTQLARLPSMAAQLRSYAESFEHDMAQRHFMTSDESPLSDFCSSFERKHAEKRRCAMLGQARDLLLKSDYHNTVEVGIEVRRGPNDDLMGDDDGMSVFALHKCAVSLTSSKLYDLCRNTMEEAVESSLDVLAPTLYRTARELLDLFRAIVPAAHGSEIANIPRTAAVFHNDCVFFAHNCLTLGLEYKEKFNPTEEEDVRGQMLRQTCMFVDMVPPFRELADRSMGDMIEKQKMQLLDIVGSQITLLGDALQSSESLVEWTDAETALTAGLNHLRHLSQDLKPILSKEVYAISLGNLVDTIFALYLDRIMEAKAISEPACHFVSALCRKATRGMSELVDGCRLWDRFVAVGQLMDMSLVDIESALAEGVFRSITGPELSRLIMATFDDSEKRRRLLKALASDQQR